MTIMSTATFDRCHEVAANAAVATGVGPLWFVTARTVDRAVAAGRDDRGFSFTTEQLVWAAVMLAIVAAVVLVVRPALENKANDVGTEIQSTT
jgi:hypothetical protein